MSRNLVVLVNPGHDDTVDPKIAISYGARSRKVRRDDPPISIINMGGYVRDHGYDVVILDTHVEPNYLERLEELVRQKPLVIGFSVILGKFTKNSIELTKMVKDLDQDITVVWGGKLVYLAQEQVFSGTLADFIILGDGEIPFVRLLDCLRKEQDYRQIPSLGYRENDTCVINPDTDHVENLDDIYISKDFGWDLVRDKINYQQIPYFVNLYTSRGCKYNCSFCYLKDIKNRAARSRFRRRSAENIIREIEYLKTTYGINVVTFGDDDFLYDPEQVVAVLDYLKQNNMYIEHIWTNIHNLTPENISLLAGVCQTVCYSIETASHRLQKILRKTISIERMASINKKLREVGISTVHNLMFGVPTETDEETKMSIDLLKQLKEINPYMRANTYILSPIPGTDLFEMAKTMTGKDIPWDMSDLADFHFRYMGKAASKFRPYLTPEDNLFYETVSELANELFTELNDVPSPELLARIASSPRLQYIFGEVENIPLPPVRERKYILDKVIDAVKNKTELPRLLPF